MKQILQQASRKLKLFHLLKMMEGQINQTMNQKYKKDAFTVNYTITLTTIFFENTNMASHKGFSSQQAFPVMIEKWKIQVITKNFTAAILTDLSKAFDCICRSFLIETLNTNEFIQNPLKLIYDYFSDRSQAAKVGSSFSAYSAYLDIIHGVSEGSILGLLFLTLFRMGGRAKGSQFFHCSFCKRSS